jgi:hypothetical protein
MRLLALALLPSLGCGVVAAARNCPEATGPVTRQPRAAGAFHAIRSSGSVDVVLIPGTQPRVEVEAPADAQARIKTTVADGELRIATEGCLETKTPVRVHVAAPGLDAIALAGSGDVDGRAAPIKGKELAVALDGSGDVDLAVAVTKLSIALQGSGDVDLAGAADALSIALEGSGDVDAIGIPARTASVALAGSGDVKVHAKERLDAVLAGSGEIRYRGKPTVNQRVSGSGEIAPE